jgi:Niemann-Pick C2 protein
MASAGTIDFQACTGADVPVGTGIVVRVDGVADGTGEVTLVKGQTYNLEIEFTASGASDSLSNKLFGEIGGIPIAWSGVNEDACTNLPTGSCPIASGTKYVYTNTLTVEESYPNISLKIIWKIVDDAGKNQVCFKLPAKIVAA